MRQHPKFHFVIQLVLILTLILFFTAFAQGASVSGMVFWDGNRNGLRDGDERALQGAEITLCRADDKTEQIIALTKSASDGQFSFSGLQAGEYFLLISMPDDFFFSAPAQNGSFALPGEGGRSKTPLFSLEEGGSFNLIIGGTKVNAYINVIAFGDENMNGGRFSSEPLLRDVEVDLVYVWQGEAYVIASKLTNREGFVQFRGLTPGTYQIAVRMPEPYIIGPLGQKTSIYYNVIPPTDSGEGISEPFDTGASIGLGVGGVLSGSLEGRVWLDSNMNGILEPNEGGRKGIQIELENQALGVTRSLVSEEGAVFRFDDLQPGQYTVKATLPEGIMFAKEGSPSLFWDGFSAQQSAKVSIAEGQTTKLTPIGVMSSSGVTVVAFHDVNVNGQKDEGEPAFSGAMVEAVLNGAAAASVLSNNEGIAVLPRVRGGEIEVRVTLPDGQIFSVPGEEKGNAFYDVSAAASLTKKQTLQDGEHVTLLAGVTLSAAITGTLFLDSNLSGVRDEAESFLIGFTVQAIDPYGRVAAEAQTDAAGQYLLDGLVPSSYSVRFLLISPYVFSSSSQTGAAMENKVREQFVAYGETAPLPLLPGQRQDHADAGVFRSAVMEGAVLLGDDSDNFSGKQGGLAGVQITLMDENGLPVSDYTVAESMEDGTFSLKGALPGVYSLLYVLPENAKFSQPLTDEPFYLSGIFEVKESEVLALDPIFAVKTGTLSGTAFLDRDNDGSFNDGDALMQEAAVKITNVRTGEIYETLSNDNGAYLITGIRPGNYDVSAELPEGISLDANEMGLVPASLSGTSTGKLDVAMGAQIRHTLLAGVLPIQINGVSFYDNDLNEGYSPEKDEPYPAQFTLTHRRTGTQITLSADQNGAFSVPKAFPGLYEVKMTLPDDHLLTHPVSAVRETAGWTAPVTLDAQNQLLELAFVEQGSLSGFIWNMDGSTQDIAGILVELRDGAGRTFGTVSTDAQGRFAFFDLLPLSYTLYAKLPDAYRFARQIDIQQRVSVITSDIAGADSPEGESGLIPLLMGEEKTGQDIGMGAPGKLGDFAWLDLDGDGMQDAGEPGLPGIVVQLYQYGALSAEAQTDDYGRYLMTGLYPGSYTLRVKMPEEVKPTGIQIEFPLVASILKPGEDLSGIAENIIVPSGGRNLSCDLGFALKVDGKLPPSLLSVPQKDWTQVNEQKPQRYENP